MKPSGWLWLAALSLLIAGLIIGFSPVKSPAGNDCGNAFHAHIELLVPSADCLAPRADRQVNTWVPLALAVVAGGAAAVVANASNGQRKS